MKISKLIEELEKKKAQIGDAEVQVRDSEKCWLEVEVCELVNISNRPGQIKWGVFLDC